MASEKIIPLRLLVEVAYILRSAHLIHLYPFLLECLLSLGTYRCLVAFVCNFSLVTEWSLYTTGYHLLIHITFIMYFEDHDPNDV